MRRSELLVIALLGLTALAAAAFVALFFAFPDNQLLGATLGLALGSLGVSLILAGKRIVPREQEVEQRPELVRPETEEQAEDAARRGVEAVSRRKLLRLAAAGAGAALAAALAVPVTSLGPAVGDTITTTPWRRGRRVVDERGEPVLADDVAPGTFLTGFPEGAAKSDLGASIVLVRVDPDELELGSERAGWAPEGIVAYSKVCTHAACAVSLYRHPNYEPTAERPALVCPCHYSTFDPARGAQVLFGPASRPLPQLPLAIGRGRELRATGDFSDPVGPSWANVRRQ